MAVNENNQTYEALIRAKWLKKTSKSKQTIQKKCQLGHISSCTYTHAYLNTGIHTHI